MVKYLVILLIALITNNKNVCCNHDTPENPNGDYILVDTGYSEEIFPISLKNIDSVILYYAPGPGRGGYVTVVVENDVDGLELLHKFVFVVSARYSSVKFSLLKFNISMSISKNDLAGFIGSLSAILEPQNQNIEVYSKFDKYIIYQGAVIKKFDTMPQSFENYLDQKNHLRFVVLIKNVSASFIPEKFNRCKELRFWIDNYFSAEKAMKVLEQYYDSDAMKKLSLSYDREQGSTQFFNSLFVDLHNGLDTHFEWRSKGWKLKIVHNTDLYHERTSAPNSTSYFPSPSISHSTSVPYSVSNIVFERT